MKTEVGEILHINPLTTLDNKIKKEHLSKWRKNLLPKIGALFFATLFLATLIGFVIIKYNDIDKVIRGCYIIFLLSILYWYQANALRVIREFKMYTASKNNEWKRSLAYIEKNNKGKLQIAYVNEGKICDQSGISPYGDDTRRFWEKSVVTLICVPAIKLAMVFHNTDWCDKDKEIELKIG